MNEMDEWESAWSCYNELREIMISTLQPLQIWFSLNSLPFFFSFISFFMIIIIIVRILHNHASDVNSVLSD